ncbi:FecR family protein [Myroides odoratimimus]|uniref:FecR family protein n=1 Tax=Myroides odoratimimus TaxID=76832 RepID=UPI002578255E|nr:FecR family protein [Myroides odoratimimus]MDM1454253.1 FecR family protein [Myroides odoratimimus]MDM1477976.1 FecR family protein [Myroides odoratimimus]MDM1490290.1 FecR family protein [Myroides odoratimimus]
MQNKFKHFLNKYLLGTANSTEKKVVEDFSDNLQRRPLIELKIIQENSKLRSSIYNSIKYKTRERKRRKNYRLLSIVFSLLLVIGLTIYQKHISINNQELTYTTSSELAKHIILSDGTAVTLSSNSTLIVSNEFNQSSREIKLIGEAYFQVAKDASRPFIISSDNFETQVLGTSFWVKRNIVEVSTGRVKVSNLLDRENYVILTADEKALLKDHRLYKNTIDVFSCISSTSSYLMMNNITLTQWKQIIEKEFDIQIHFLEDIISTKEFIQADFRNSTLADIVQSVSYMYDFDYKYENKNIIINNTKK